MANKIDQFWEVFKAVAGDASADVTESTNALAKSDRTKVESYFSNVIDQFTFSTADYNRLRKFLIDLYATHRTQSSISLKSTDPHALTNSDLDELFRSFGYPESTSLKGFDENPLEQKVQFFLDLVNLYKVKGTPQSLVDVLQYYGVTEVDIYEFFIKKSDPGSLIFDGNAVAGTTVSPSDVSFPYANITASDPHWLYTEQQILQLDQLNKINLPSKTPYLGVQPVVDLEGAEMAIIERYVQDQYDYYAAHGSVPPPTAEVTYVGETVSLLELYLACVYMFNKLFDQGSDKPTRFICYDGTNVGDEVSIIDEFESLTQQRVETRDQLKTRQAEYLDIFSRIKARNFLVDESSSGTFLSTINPSLKSALDTAGEPLDVLYSLLKDLALWVRANIGYGFVNFGFILFGIQEFFKDLKPVIDFFKPYRARLLLLERLQVRNRLFNTVIVEDDLDVDTNLQFHDFLTADSTPCCETTDSTCGTSDIQVCRRQFVGGTVPDYNWRNNWATGTAYAVDDAVASGVGTQYICIAAHTSNTPSKPGTGASWTTYWQLMSSIVCGDTTSTVSFYSRETYDCDSYYDIGAVSDVPDDINIYVEQTYYDHLRCPDDGTGFVVSEILDIEYDIQNTTAIPSDSSSVVITLVPDQANTNYSVGLTVVHDNSEDPTDIPAQFNYIVTDKQTGQFEISLSAPVPSDNYSFNWAVYDSTNTSIVDIDTTTTSQLVVMSTDCTSSNYSISGSISNIVDANPSIYGFTISDRTPTSFVINFSGVIDSANYKFEYFVCEGDLSGLTSITPGSQTVDCSFPSSMFYPAYPVVALVETDDPNVYSWTVTEKRRDGFTIEFSAPVDGTNCNVSWVLPSTDVPNFTEFEYYQSGGFRDFDEDGSFDCTHGFDLMQITIEDAIVYLLQENGFSLLQENDAHILI